MRLSQNLCPEIYCLPTQMHLCWRFLWSLIWSISKPGSWGCLLQNILPTDISSHHFGCAFTSNTSLEVSLRKIGCNLCLASETIKLFLGLLLCGLLALLSQLSTETYEVGPTLHRKGNDHVTYSIFPVVHSNRKTDGKKDSDPPRHSQQREQVRWKETSRSWKTHWLLCFAWKTWIRHQNFRFCQFLELVWF